MNKKNKKFRVIFLVIIPLVLFFFLLPVAFGLEEKEIDRLKKKADVVEKKIDKSEAEILKYSRKESKMYSQVSSCG